MHTSIYGSVYFCKTIRCIFERRNWFKRRRPSVSIISHSARVDYVRCMKPIRNYLKIAYKDLWEQSAREFGDGARTARFFFASFLFAWEKWINQLHFPFRVKATRSFNWDFLSLRKPIQPAQLHWNKTQTLFLRASSSCLVSDDKASIVTCYMLSP